MTDTSRGRTHGDGSLREQIARNIRASIEAGVLRDGEVLPSTRELAAEWGVSVFTITEAMKDLSNAGLVVSKSRSKRVVQRPSTAQRVELRGQPHVLLIGGYAGSGKTELARILAHGTGWPVLDKDTLTRAVVEAALEAHGCTPDDRESDIYLEVIRPREYEALISATRENVECGNSAIVAAPFIREFQTESWLSRTKADFTALGATMTLVWVNCDPDTMQTYLRHRGAARDSAKLADWPAYLSRIDVAFRPNMSHVVVDNSRSSTPLQSQATELLKSLIGGPVK